MTYVSGFMSPVEDRRKADYIASAKAAWPLFAEYGALELVENWGVHVPDGKQTDMRRAVVLKEDETVVFSWVLWPDKATADACMASVEHDERWRQLDMPFDGKRMIHGGFETIFKAGAE
ncbi:DUF1428 domain-containing protein [Salinisphaera sp. T31B1]|uniref:DUF1428 domain-containing protein n=1 Tax=Salinisphaera sp. T31B1 TaxID=727963 RepID=UPI00333F41B9